MNFIGDDFLSAAEMQFKLRAEIDMSCSRDRPCADIQYSEHTVGKLPLISSRKN